MATYTWVLAGCQSRAFGGRELSSATGRTVTWRLDANATAQFSLDGRHDEADDVVELATDLVIYRDGDKVFRGRIATDQDDIGETKHTCQFTATDYRGMLAYREVGAAGAAYSATAGGAIALDLVADSQALSGGNWGVAAGVGTASGTVRDNTLNPGTPLDKAIGDMGRLDNGYEWEISADLELNLWHPTRGADNGVILDYGGLVARARRLLDPKDFANAGLVTGAQGLTPATATTAGIGADERGRWETYLGTTIENPATLTAKAAWLVDQSSTLRPTWSVTLRPGRWGGPDHIWLGDTVQLRVKSGRLAVNEAHRVAEISVQPGDKGDETVTMGLLAA